MYHIREAAPVLAMRVKTKLAIPRIRDRRERMIVLLQVPEHPIVVCV